MIVCLYIGIVLLATTLGAIAGLGGGVIIKPLLDAVGYHDASTIGVYSCLAVFTMCIVSIIKQLKNGFSFNIKVVVAVSMGSLLGGVLGDCIFNTIASSMDNHVVKIIQASLLGVTLLLIMWYTLNKNKIRHYKVNNVVAIFLVGLFLGAISVFLGIGGGPMNVALLMICFSFAMKEATIYSIATIFFSQLSKITTLIMGAKLFTYDLSVVPYICISAIVGGLIGTVTNQKLNTDNIEKVFNIIMVILLIVCSFNVFSNVL